ncbi:MAG: type VI secretion system baseplate subunit TssG [Candidatus Binataceae bacterium]
MAAASGRSDPSLEELLFEQSYHFDFFAAVHLLEMLYPDRKPVGRQASPEEEAVRFRAHLSLSFPPSAIQEIEPPGDGRPARMTAAFMGLTGPLGVLPRHYTELLLERMRRKDAAARDFFDLFNHRIIALFHRAWEKYRFYIGYEQAARNGGAEDAFTAHLFDLLGMGTNGLRGRLEFADDALLYYAGLLGQRPRSASAVINILGDYFGVPVEIAQFVGQWLEITEENRTRLGPGEVNNLLGANAVAGTRTWDQQAKFRVRVGPLSYDEFARLLPGGDAFRPFVQLTRYCVGQELDFDLQLVLKAPEVPWWHLGDQRPRLGFSTWLKTKEFDRDADQVVFSGGLTRIGALPG